MLKFSQIFNYYYILKQKNGIFFSKLFSETYIKIYLSIALVINVGNWIFARYIDAQIDEKMIALHYNVDFGFDYYGRTAKIYIIPFLGILIIIVNSLLFNSVNVYRDRKFLSHLLLASAILINIILLASTATVYLINF
jgi:hypothetical protein